MNRLGIKFTGGRQAPNMVVIDASAGGEEGINSRFRCHTGHAYTPQALLSGLIENIDEGFWQGTRALEEAVMLLEHIAERFMDTNQPGLAAPFLEKANTTRRVRMHYTN